MTFQVTWRNSRWLWHKCVCCISQVIILTFFKRCCWAWCYFAANLLRYMCAKNYQNIAWFDELMAKIKRCSFLPHSVVSNAVSHWDCNPNNDSCCKTENKNELNTTDEIRVMTRCVSVWKFTVRTIFKVLSWADITEQQSWALDWRRIDGHADRGENMRDSSV